MLQTPRRDGVLTLYLGSEIGQSISVEREVLARLEKAGKLYQSIATKIRIFWTLVLSVLLYGAETWTVTQHDIHKLKSFQMRCFHDILGITLSNQVRSTDKDGASGGTS